MKRLLLLLLAGAMLLCLAGCGQGDEAQISLKPVAAPVYPKGISFEDYEAKGKRQEENPLSESFLEAVNRFSYQTAALVLKDSNTNQCYSPLSLYFALALAASGAGGETQEELLALLGMDDPAALSAQCGNLYRTLYTDNEICKLKIANSLWLDREVKGQEVSFKEDFLDNATANFYATLFSADFAAPETAEAMSAWISENTNGTLAPQFAPDPQQIMSIINTVYFCDEWTDRFNADQTQADQFYLESGESVTCDFMNRISGSQGFSRGADFTRAALGLKNSGSMVFILPDAGVKAGALLASPEKITEIFTGGESKYGEVIWSVPKFNYGSSYKLKEVLRELGVARAFLPEADFSGITEETAYVSEVSQETHIAIDENGVEASAFTKLDLTGAGLPEDKAEMILNRPFIFGITAANGTLLFAGVCMNPAAAEH